MLSRSLFPSRNTTHHHPLFRSRPPGIRSSRRFDQISGNNWLVAWPLNSSANLPPRISSTPAKQLPFRAKQQQEKSCFSSKEISLQLCAPFNLSLKFIAIFVMLEFSFFLSPRYSRRNLPSLSISIFPLAKSRNRKASLAKGAKGKNERRREAWPADWHKDHTPRSLNVPFAQRLAR